jgi:hypothetical protein
VVKARTVARATVRTKVVKPPVKAVVIAAVAAPRRAARAS